MRKSRVGGVALAALVAVAATVWFAGPASAGTRPIVSSGSARLNSGPLVPSDQIQSPELRRDAEAALLPLRPGSKNTKFQFPKKPFDVPVVSSASVAGSNPGLGASWQGLNFFNQRFANGGNQFSLEPPDQGLCVGNGHVFEVVNSVLRIYTTSGTPETGAVDLNTFLGYPAAINRTTGEQGPFVFDPSCLFDKDVNRFFVVVAVLEVVPDTGELTGKGHLDLAVSKTGNPVTGGFTLYRVPFQNDGTDGTPNHHCDLGPCIGDYPHIGADRNGIFLSTNEYSLFGVDPNAAGFYTGAQIYGFDKVALAGAPFSINVTHVENAAVEGIPGWTLWPAQSPPGQASREANGTEYFLMTITGDGSETGNPTGTANRIGVAALTNTKSLASARPALNYSARLLSSEVQTLPPRADQKTGPTPLRDCLNNDDLFGPGVGCWALFFDTDPGNQRFGVLDSNDGRMQQTWFTDGKLIGASDTGVRVGGQLKAGIAWFVVEPVIDGGKVNGGVGEQGYLALANTNLIYPAIATTRNGDGVIAFTVVGENYFPSAGYANFGQDGLENVVHVAASGVGPQDGFTEYPAFNARPRWGDYGAAVLDGSDVWMASEYIAQSCDFNTWLATAFRCGNTRGALGNWSTRVSKVTPEQNSQQNSH